MDQGTIKVKTPNFEIFGAQRVDVHVNISNQGWTVNKMNFDYFANTHAKNCLAFGPSLLADVSAPPLPLCLPSLLSAVSFFWLR